MFHSSLKDPFITDFANCLLQSVFYCPEFSVGCSAGLRAIINSYLLTVIMWVFAGESPGFLPGWHIHSSLRGEFINMWCRISWVASGRFLAFSQYLFQKLVFVVDGGYFAKRIVFTYCSLKGWCQMFEDISSSLRKLRVLPLRWPPPEFTWGREERWLAGPKPAWPVQTVTGRSLHCLPTPGLLPNFFQAVCHCLLLQCHGPPGFGEK